MNIDHIHFYVENANQTRDWLIQTMGLQSLGQKVETHTQTEYVGNAHLLFLVSAPLTSLSPVADYLKKHPSGVVDLAFQIQDLELMLTKVLDLGIQIFQKKVSSTGEIQSFKIKGWGDYYHTLVKNKASISRVNELSESSVQITAIDHLVLNVHSGQLDLAVDWYKTLFDFQVQQIFTIQTNYSGLYSKALIDHTGKLQFNINEPSTHNSQIQTFLEYNHGAGIQHIALYTQNIFQAVSDLRKKGLGFLPIPKSYYAALKYRSQQLLNVAFNAQEWQALEALEILLDWSDQQPEALLMQIFTQPIFDQPTFFFELIERRQQKQGFGEGNFLALFQAMEALL